MGFLSYGDDAMKLVVAFLLLLVFSKDVNAASATVTVGVTFIEAFEVAEDDKQTLESNVEEPIVVIELDENGEEIITYIFQ